MPTEPPPQINSDPVPFAHKIPTIVDALSALGNTRMLRAARTQNHAIQDPDEYTTTPRMAVDFRALTSAGRAVLVFAYPFVAHFGVMTNSVTLIAIALGLLIVLPMLPALGQRSVPAWLALGPVVAALWWLSRSTHATLPLYIAPVLVPGFMAGVFGSTLFAGQVPLIEQLIRIMEPGPDGREEPERCWSTRAG